MNGDDFMPAIKLDEQQRANGLRELILHGDIYCLPDHIFIVPPNLLRFLDKANISYTFVRGRDEKEGREE